MALSPVSWLPVHRDQVWAQHSVMSMGKLPFKFPINTTAIIATVSFEFWHCCLGDNKDIWPVKTDAIFVTLTAQMQEENRDG